MYLVCIGLRKYLRLLKDRRKRLASLIKRTGPVLVFNTYTKYAGPKYSPLLLRLDSPYLLWVNLSLQAWGLHIYLCIIYVAKWIVICYVLTIIIARLHTIQLLGDCQWSGSWIRLPPNYRMKSESSLICSSFEISSRSLIVIAFWLFQNSPIYSLWMCRRIPRITSSEPPGTTTPPSALPRRLVFNCSKGSKLIMKQLCLTRLRCQGL